MQGAHHVPQKSSKYTWPSKSTFVMVTVGSSNETKENSGTGFPASTGVLLMPIWASDKVGDATERTRARQKIDFCIGVSYRLSVLAY